MENKEAEHLLALKVMRLTRPTLCNSLPIARDALDSTDTQSDNDYSNANLLMLPQSFGNIYLGETFSCYMSVHNDSKTTVTHVSVQADLQIGPQKLLLTGHSGNCNQIFELSPGQSVDDVIHHEVKEIGTHILACTVRYNTESDEKMNFRKFFKFQVSKPLDVKTKFYNAESDEVYLEAQLQNITSSPMCLEKVSLEPSNNFTPCEFNTVKKGDSVESIFGSVNCLNPMDCRQYLFCLTPKPEVKGAAGMLKGVTSIGKLDIVWYTSMGERGHLQTSQLERLAPDYGDIKFTIESAPGIVAFEQVFSMTCRVSNTCTRALQLTMSLDNRFAKGLLWQGISSHDLMTLEPQASITFNLEAVPLKTGLVVISGIRLMDTFLKRLYEYDDAGQVFVCFKEALPELMEKINGAVILKVKKYL